jgi:hypothetical protein
MDKPIVLKPQTWVCSCQIWLGSIRILWYIVIITHKSCDFNQFESLFIYRDSQKKIDSTQKSNYTQTSKHHISNLSKNNDMHGKNQYGIREHTKELLRNKSKKMIY